MVTILMKKLRGSLEWDMYMVSKCLRLPTKNEEWRISVKQQATHHVPRTYERVFSTLTTFCGSTRITVTSPPMASWAFFKKLSLAQIC
jgi:hypothetical protein